MYKLNLAIFHGIKLQNHPRDKIHFVTDDTTIAKTGKMIENVSYIYDHNIGRSVLGFCIVTLGLLTGCGFYPIDFAYRFGKKKECQESRRKNRGPPKHKRSKEL